MLTLKQGDLYTRKEIWSLCNPDLPFPSGGNWLTGYTRQEDALLIFANLGVPGRTGHDFPNSYDAATGDMEWYGKPNAHSAQPTFDELLRGILKPFVFVRWQTENPKFLLLGSPSIKSYQDNQVLNGAIKTLKVNFLFAPSKHQLESPPPDGLPLAKLEGGRTSVQVNKYERDPRLRIECIEAHGATCKICEFDFETIYGELGTGYIHVHHIKPLAEMEGQELIDPISDLIPVCPNCHAMLHAKTPALMPDELKLILEKHGPKDVKL